MIDSQSRPYSTIRYVALYRTRPAQLLHQRDVVDNPNAVGSTNLPHDLIVKVHIPRAENFGVTQYCGLQNRVIVWI